MVAITAATCGAEPPCDKLVGLLATAFVYNIPNSRLARVEIRQCSPEASASIQLVAWRTGGEAPTLVLNTDDFGVVQMFARENVFVIETGGATRDQVFVIEYNRGEPRVVLKRTTKGTARITVSRSALDLVIEDIYAGDSPPRRESHRFELNPDGTKPR